MGWKWGILEAFTAFDHLDPLPGTAGRDDDDMPGVLEDDMEMIPAANERVEAQRVGVGRGSWGQPLAPSLEPCCPTLRCLVLRQTHRLILCLPERAPGEGVRAAGASPCRGPQSLHQGRGGPEPGSLSESAWDAVGKPRGLPALPTVLRADGGVTCWARWLPGTHPWGAAGTRVAQGFAGFISACSSGRRCWIRGKASTPSVTPRTSRLRKVLEVELGKSGCSPGFGLPWMGQGPAARGE